MKSILNQCLDSLDSSKLEEILSNKNCIPSRDRVFNAFNADTSSLKYILFGESPYPRIESAIGYAFIDGKVTNLWNDKGGISKDANRATSLRNLIKCSLVAEGRLNEDTTKEAVMKADKSGLALTMMDIKENLENNGVMLLNASLTIRKDVPVRQDAKFWLPFMDIFLEKIYKSNPNIKLILWGGIAKTILSLPSASQFEKTISEHPYNISFIQNKENQELLKNIGFLKSN